MTRGPRPATEWPGGSWRMGVGPPFATKMKTLALLALVAIQSTSVYHDPAGRFTFSYPSSFGTTSVGTDDGFEDRVAAVRFSSFPARFGGEAALTRGFPLVDIQAAGGLYDQLTLDVLP